LVTNVRYVLEQVDKEYLQGTSWPDSLRKNGC